MRPSLKRLGLALLAVSATFACAATAQAGWRYGVHPGYYGQHRYVMHGYGAWGAARVGYAPRYAGVNYYRTGAFYGAHRRYFVSGGGGLAPETLYGGASNGLDSNYYGPGFGPAEVAPTYSQGYEAPAQVAPTYSQAYQTAAPYPAPSYVQTYAAPTTVYQNVTRSYTVPVQGYRTIAQTRYVPVTQYRAVTSEVRIPVTTYRTFERTEQVPTTVWRPVHRVCSCSYAQ
jgi:hypothetical protein